MLFLKMFGVISTQKYLKNSVKYGILRNVLRKMFLAIKSPNQVLCSILIFYFKK
jgi:hypothetical protein